MQITPFGDYVLVERAQKKGESDGGILIPDSAKKKSYLGTVLAVGDGKWVGPGEKELKKVPLDLRPGDKVVIPMFGGIDIPSDVPDSKGLLVIREGEIMAVVE